MKALAETRIRDLPLGELKDLLATGRLTIHYGAAVVKLHGALPGMTQALHQVYGTYRFHPNGHPFHDYHVQLKRGRGVRAFIRPQARFLIDGLQPFEPFPAANALPLFEWGVNWCFGQRANQFVVLHSGTLARGDAAVILAAPPGSGKSTLAAAMMLRGFRLLSDEFGVLAPETGVLHPMLKPIALKNESVPLIRALSTTAVIGPLYRGTRKGDVAHLAPDEASVDAVDRPARPRLVIFPSFQAGSRLGCHRLSGEAAFANLAFNSFNYPLLGPTGFEAVANVIDACPAYKLRYSDLDQAIDHIGELLDEAEASGISKGK